MTTFELSLEQWAQIAAISVAIVGIATLGKGIIEYTNESKRKRAEQFFLMRRRFKENQNYMQICKLLEKDDAELKEIPYTLKRDFLGFYEEIAIMMNSGLIRKEVAHYMFGYYAIKCWDSQNFWHEVNKNSDYWSAFKNFSLIMKKIELNFKGKNLRF